MSYNNDRALVPYSNPRSGFRQLVPALAGAISSGSGVGIMNTLIREFGRDTAKYLYRQATRYMRETLEVRERPRKTPSRHPMNDPIEHPQPIVTEPSESGTLPVSRKSGVQFNYVPMNPITFGRIKHTYSSAFRTKVEKGGVATHAQCLYLGHGMYQQEVGIVIMGCFLKALAARAGMPFYSVKDFVYGQRRQVVSPGIGYPFTISITYRKNELQQLDSVTHIFDALDRRWEDVIFDVNTAVKAAVGPTDKFIPMEFQLRTAIDDGTAARVLPLTTMDVSDMYIDLAFVSKLHVHNQTGGSSGTDDEITSVNANPLNFKRYINYGRALIIRRHDSATEDAGLYISANGPTKAYGFDNANFGEDMSALLRRPPTKSTWENCVQSTSGVLAPGGHMLHVIKYEISDTIQNLFNNRLNNEYGAGNNFDIGLNEWIGYDKLVRTGSGSADIEIGYECNQVYMCKLRKKRKRWMPMTTVLAHATP